MNSRVLLVTAALAGLLLGGTWQRLALAQPAPLPTPSSSAIECALDPKCAKPQSRPRSMRRGVTVEGGQVEQPLSVNLYVNFAFNSAELTSDARITLDQLGTALRDPRLAGFNFVIAGHTDAKGGAEFNQKLSERRAEAVRSYLIAQFGIAAERLTAKGYGKTQLLDSQHPEDGVNRRVQVINADTIGQSHN
jgi:outer membrane protein OmpA-like peptidoglycan-associated protein